MAENSNIAPYRNASYPTLTTVDETLDQIISDGLALAELTAPEELTEYTQTYSTAAQTVPAAVDDLVLTDTAIAAATPSLTLTDAVPTNAGTVAASLDQAQADLGTAINTLAADVLALKKVVTSLIDDLQAWGVVA